MTADPTSSPPSIDCEIAGAAQTGTCSDTFSDAGGGGSFELQALPAVGSKLVAWTACDDPANASLVCLLSFDSGRDTTFSVTARFDIDACYTVKAAVPNSVAGTGPAVPSNLSPAYGAQALVDASIEQVVTIGSVGQLVPNAYGYGRVIGTRGSRRSRASRPTTARSCSSSSRPASRPARRTPRS